MHVASKIWTLRKVPPNFIFFCGPITQGCLPSCSPPSIPILCCLHLTIPTLFKSLQWELRYRQKHISVFMQNAFNYRPITPKLQCVAHVCGVPDMNFQENAFNRSWDTGQDIHHSSCKVSLIINRLQSSLWSLQQICVVSQAWILKIAPMAEEIWAKYIVVFE